MVDREDYRRSLAKHNIGAREATLFDRIALERRDITATKAEQSQNAKHWILRLNAAGPQKPLRQRPEFAVALQQCLKMQDAHLAETRQFYRPIRPEHEQRLRSTIRRRRQLFSMSIGKLDGGTTESHGATRRQRLHLQHRSGKTHNRRRVGAHGIPHDLITGGDFGFPGTNSRKSTGGVDRTPTHKTHLCSTV